MSSGGNSAGARLYKLIAEPGAALAPGIYDALSARLAQLARFDVVYASIRKLIAVQKRAVDFIYANPADAEKIYAEVWKTEPAEAHREFQQFLSWRIWAGGKCSKAGLDALSASLQEIGDVDRPVDWPNLIDQRFLEPEQRIPL